MGVKVSRIHRLLKLITLLQTGRQYRVRDLMRAASISRRTAFRDLTMLKAAGVPVAYDRQAKTYTIRRDFFLPPVNFTLSEILALALIMRKYGSGWALPNYSAAAGAMTKIESALPPAMQDYCGSALDQIEVRHGPMTDAGRAASAFELMWGSARKRESVDIRYDSYYEHREIETRLDPYRVVFVTRAWYVIGFSSMHAEIRTFKLERIIGARPTGEHFEMPPDFDLARSFGQAWRMIPGGQRYKVRIRFSPKLGRNVEEVLWHPTQQTRLLEDGSLVYEVEVDGVEEIAWWVLGYGKEAVVESPAALRDVIREHALAMAAMYEPAAEWRSRA